MGRNFRIAVIGAGSAGTYAAYHLYKKLGEHIDFTIYERKEHAGGRAWNVDFAGTHTEVGGVLLHSSGAYGYELMDFTGCKEGVAGVSIDGKRETYAFWTDRGFPVFTKTTLASMALGILRYVGPRSALAVTNAAKNMAKNWESVYDLQAKGCYVKKPEELLAQLGLLDATQQDIRSFLKDQGVNTRMAEDIVEPIIHNMYNQGLELNAFAGLVGLAGAGLAGGHLFAVEGGNWTLFQKTLEKMHVDLRLNTVVTRVDVAASDTSDTTFTVYTEHDQPQEFDVVLLAAPPALSGITLTQGDNEIPLVKNEYQRVHTTLVVGSLRPEYFHAPQDKQLPSTIFTADSAKAPFKSVGITGFSPQYNTRMYKIFSAEHAMTEQELSEIFSDVKDIYEHVWAGAYPKLGTQVQHVPFELVPGLYFANAFETAAGSIEVEAVSGANAAGLAEEYLKELAIRAWKEK